MERKAGINMSINMIIVLIIAIVVVGLALTFIQDMFSSVEDRFAQQFPEPRIDVNAQQPIGIPSELKFSAGEQMKRISMKILNTLPEAIGTADTNATECGGTDYSPDAGNQGTITIENKTIKPGQTKVAKMIINLNGTQPYGEICKIRYDRGGQSIQGSFFVVRE